MESHLHPHAYTDWCAIAAGTVLSIAISLVLLNFGAVVGLADKLDAGAATITAAKVFSIGVWLLWIQMIAALSGGYMAGRLRTAIGSSSEHEREMRDGMHGLLVWASGTVLVAIGGALLAALTAISADATGNAGAVHATLSETARRIEEHSAIIFAFGAAASSLVAGVVSWWAATVGGEHRDNNVDLVRYFSFRRV